MLSNAYFLAKFRFDTAENEPAKILQNLPILLTLTPKLRISAPRCGGRLPFGRSPLAAPRHPGRARGARVGGLPVGGLPVARGAGGPQGLAGGRHRHLGPGVANEKMT